MVDHWLSIYTAVSHEPGFICVEPLTTMHPACYAGWLLAKIPSMHYTLLSACWHLSHFWELLQAAYFLWSFTLYFSNIISISLFFSNGSHIEVSVMRLLGSMIALNVFYYYEVIGLLAGRTPFLNFIFSFPGMPVLLQLPQGLPSFLVIPSGQSSLADSTYLPWR